MVDGRQDCEERGELSLLLLLHVLVRLPAWYHDILHLMLKFQACPIKMKDLLWSSARIFLKCSAYLGPATPSADADSPVFFTLYRRICFSKFSNYPLLVWKMPFFSPSHGTVVVYLHGLLPYQSTTD